MKNKIIKLRDKLKQFIDDNYFDEPSEITIVRKILSSKLPHLLQRSNEVFVADEPFNRKLFKLIDASGKSDVEIYKKAGIDRRHYSKIKSSNNHYIPLKKTIFAFIIALELSLEEAELLLESGGYAFSQSHLFDVIIKFYIMEGIYDIATINEALLSYDQPLIGY